MLNKKNQEPKRLKAKHHIYDLVEDRNTKKKPEVNVILTTYVDGLGNKGDSVVVTSRFAYNKLLLPGLAVYDTPENKLKHQKIESANKADEITYSSQFVLRTINVMQNRLIGVVMNKTQPWTIERWHIRTSLRKAGINVLDESAIELPKEKITGPDPDKQGKQFVVTVTINNTEKAKVRCRIHHYSNDPKKAEPFIPEFWKLPPEPLFPDQPDQVIPLEVKDRKQPKKINV